MTTATDAWRPPSPLPAHLRWLLDADPAIRWQVLRDLSDAPAEEVAAERARVGTHGWGAQVLALQGEDGNWSDELGPNWASTLYAMLLLKAFGLDPQSDAARRRAEDYLLDRAMMRRLSNGELIAHAWTRFAFPTTWHYDVLRGLDYLRDAGVAPDERVDEAVQLVAKRRHQNGRWPLAKPHHDPVGLDMGEERGKASRWNMLRALRVFDWYTAGRSPS